MFLGENLPSWLILAIGGALAVGNFLAIVKPRPAPQRSEHDDVAESGVDDSTEYLERPPLLRSLFMIALGSAAAIWALASLLQ